MELEKSLLSSKQSFSLSFLIETLYPFVIAAIHATHTIHGILLALIIPFIFGKEYF
jgi:hypothetical protein